MFQDKGETLYRLYYWPVPFRGHFVRYLLAYGGAAWQEAEVDDLVRLMRAPPEDQPLPFVGPPLLHDLKADVWVSQMPAVMEYLGSRHGLMPTEPAHRAMTLKVLGDCGDVLEAITCNGGRNTLWTPEAWAAFRTDRLPLWMEVFEVTGQRHGLTREGGTMLGSAAPGVADLATAALWHTMVDRLPALRPLLEQAAPAVAALSERIANEPRIAAMRREHDAVSGGLYCGGQIEASLRAMLAADA
jgi:glutathione S-transferase